MKPGDVVRLKSGGPAMTVVEVREKREVDATFWNPDERSFCDQVFPVEALEAADAWGDAERVLKICQRFFGEHPEAVGHTLLETVKAVYTESRRAK